jgi:hemimethylated DNA binding protein
MLKTRAKYHLGQVVRHRKHPFRGVVFDVDAMFSNTEEWYEAIPEESRPQKDQPFYHLLAENDQSYYVAYVSEQNPGGRLFRQAGGASRPRRSVRARSRMGIMRCRSSSTDP